MFRDRFTLVAFCSSMAIGLCYFFVIQLYNPTYFDSGWNNPYPDTIDYLKLGDLIREKEIFSRVPDGHPDLLRTPFYPMMLAACDAVRRPLVLYLVQIFMLSASIAMIVEWARTSMGVMAAGGVLLLLLADHRLFALSYYAMSEIPAFLFMVLGLHVLGWLAFPQREFLTHRKAVVAAILQGDFVTHSPHAGVPAADPFCLGMLSADGDTKRIVSGNFAVNTFRGLLCCLSDQLDSA